MKRSAEESEHGFMPQPTADLPVSTADNARTSPMTDAIPSDLARRMTDLTPNSPKMTCVEMPDGVRKSVSHTPPPTNGTSKLCTTAVSPKLELSPTVSPVLTPTNSPDESDVGSKLASNASPTVSSTVSSSMPPPAHDRVAILDCGAQYGKVIDRRVREMNVEGIMLPLETPANVLKEGRFKAIIISGGPSSVNDPDAPPFDPQIFHLDIPVLGICYGFQMINREFGGRVASNAIREDGQQVVSIDATNALFAGVPRNTNVLLTHGDRVVDVAPGFSVIGKAGADKIITGECPDHKGGDSAAICNPTLRIYGVQFHPEVDLSADGMRMMHNFLYLIAGCEGNFTMASREEECIREIRELVGPTKKVLVMVSGGVDSTVCAALLHKALHEDLASDGALTTCSASTSSSSRVIALHVDNGFMRLDETKKVTRALSDIGLEPIVYNGSNVFRNASTEVKLPTGERMHTNSLQWTCEPEHKRRIIGDTFIKIKDDVMSTLELDVNECLLAQGTLRPDLIESASTLASSHADAIKTHHNDTQLVRDLRDKGLVVEPLRHFHKDEVRQLGRDLGLPAHLVERHPFPGPGLAIRVLCSETAFICAEYALVSSQLGVLSKLGDGDESLVAIFRNCISEGELAYLEEKMEMVANIHLLPIRSVGVQVGGKSVIHPDDQGDSRTYRYVASIETAVTEETNEMDIDWHFMAMLAKIITRIFVCINRVTVMLPSMRDLRDGHDYEIGAHSHTPTTLTPSTVEQIRLADHVATDVLAASPAVTTIAQMPVVLLPIDFHASAHHPASKRTVCLRPFITNDFMTGRPAMPNETDIDETVVQSMADSIYELVPSISMVLYDVTSKPPGTTEWE